MHEIQSIIDKFRSDKSNSQASPCIDDCTTCNLRAQIRAFILFLMVGRIAGLLGNFLELSGRGLLEASVMNLARLEC